MGLVYDAYGPYGYPPDDYAPPLPEEQPTGAPVVIESDVPAFGEPADPYASLPRCNEPQIIELGKPKKDVRLPRVIYGMPLECIDAGAAPGPAIIPVD